MEGSLDLVIIKNDYWEYVLRMKVEPENNKSY